MASPEAIRNDSNWAQLLHEPKAITGVYSGNPPPLSSFAAHSVQFNFEEVALAGQFFVLPANVPARWGLDLSKPLRVDAILQFAATRNIRLSGSLPVGATDDSNHGLPVGVTGSCTLIELDEVWIAPLPPQNPFLWRHFSFRAGQFSLELDAGVVRIIFGRRAWRDNGWT